MTGCPDEKGIYILRDDRVNQERCDRAVNYVVHCYCSYVGQSDNEKVKEERGNNSSQEVNSLTSYLENTIYCCTSNN